MIIRKAAKTDLCAIAEIYDAIHQEEKNGKTTTGWIEDVYPVKKTAENALENGWLFLVEEKGIVVCSAIINQCQDNIYSKAKWKFKAKDNEVMVLHTLVVNPMHKNMGIGTRMVQFFESYAADKGCFELRMDTNEKNTAARKLYKKLGYKEVSILSCDFNGIPNVNLVCLEKNLNK